MPHHSEWVRRQRAQWLVNLGLIDFHTAADEGRRVETSEADLPFHVVDDVHICGAPAMIFRRLSRPYGIFEECFNPRDKRGMLKRFLRDDFTRCPPNNVGSAMCLAVYWLENYWHWIYEGLPKVLLAEEAGFDGAYIVPPHRFIRESLRLVGIAEDRILDYSNQLWHVDHLYLAPRLDGEQLIRRQTLLLRLRETLLEGARRQLGAAFDTQAAGQRLYASRNRANLTRCLVNESAVRDILTRFDFVQYDGEAHNLAQQIACYSRCTAIAGPHGAAFTNTLFMPKGALVVELFSPLYIWPVSLPATRALRHRYFPLPPRLQDPGRSYPHGLEVEANPDLLETVLENELLSSALAEA